VNARAALDDPDSVFYTYQSLIALRKTLPVLTWGDYQDLLPEHLPCGATAASGRGKPWWWLPTSAGSARNGDQKPSVATGR
jgi:glycosidase